MKMAAGKERGRVIDLSVSKVKSRETVRMKQTVGIFEHILNIYFLISYIDRHLTQSLVSLDVPNAPSDFHHHLYSIMLSTPPNSL